MLHTFPPALTLSLSLSSLPLSLSPLSRSSLSLSHLISSLSLSLSSLSLALSSLSLSRSLSVRLLCSASGGEKQRFLLNTDIMLLLYFYK